MRKPVPNDDRTANVWGGDINRSLIKLDQIIKNIEAQLTTTTGLASSSQTDANELSDRVTTLLGRVQDLQDRLAQYLDRPNCYGVAADLLNEYSTMVATLLQYTTSILMSLVGTFQIATSSTYLNDTDHSYCARRATSLVWSGWVSANGYSGTITIPSDVDPTKTYTMVFNKGWLSSYTT